MKRLARMLGRMAMIALAAAGIIVLTGVYAHSTRPRVDRDSQHDVEHSGELRERRSRPTEAQLSRLPGFAWQIALVGLIALAGRKILRLRL